MKVSAVKDLLEIKEIINKEKVVSENDETIIQRLSELDKKIDRMNELFQTRPKTDRDIIVSPVKIKRKDEIINILKEHKKITSTQLSIITGISRTRCNEYLREMETEELLKGTIDDKKKFYRLI